MECPECGRRVSDEYDFCDCGEELTRSSSSDSDVYYRFATFALFAYISLLFGMVAIESIVLGVTAVGFWLASMAAMYMDLKNLDQKLRWSPWVWVVLALLFYVVAMPYYLYKRNQVSKQS